MQRQFFPNSTQTPNFIFDDWLAELSGAELKCALYIVRRTYGFWCNLDSISLSQFERGNGHDKGTGLSHQSVVAALASLEASGRIHRVRGDGVVVQYAITRPEGVKKLDQEGGLKIRPEVVKKLDQEGVKKLDPQNTSIENKERESPLPPLSEVSTEALPKLLTRWAAECGVKIPRFAVKELTSRDKRARAQAQDAEEAIAYREALRQVFTGYREDPSGVAIEDRLKRVRFSSAGGSRSHAYGSGGPNSHPGQEKPVSAPEKRLRAYLEGKGCDFSGCGPTAEWVVNEVLGFQARFPALFEDKLLPTAIERAEGLGSTVITLCLADIRQRGSKGETISEMIDRL